jgi:hypothetical protein
MRRCTVLVHGRGYVAIDYLLVIALVAIALALGHDSAIQLLLAAIAEHYQRFTWALSLP